MDSLDEDGCAPVHYAAESGHVEILNVLRTRGADVNRTVSKQNTIFSCLLSIVYIVICQFEQNYSVVAGCSFDFMPTETNSGSGVDRSSKVGGGG